MSVTLEQAAQELHDIIQGGAAPDSVTVRDAINRAQRRALSEGYLRGEFDNWLVPVHGSKFLAPPEVDIIEAATYYDANPQQVAEMRGVFSIYNPVRRRSPCSGRLSLFDLGDGHVSLSIIREPSVMVVIPERPEDGLAEDQDAFVVFRGTGKNGERIYTIDENGSPMEGVKVRISTSEPTFTRGINGEPLLFTQLQGATKSQTSYPIAVFASGENFPEMIAENRIPRMDLMAVLQSWETECSRRLYEVRGCRPSCACLTIFGRLRYRPALSPTDPLMVEDITLLEHQIRRREAENSNNIPAAAYHARMSTKVANGNLDRFKGPASEGIPIIRDWGFGDIRTL